MRGRGERQKSVSTIKAEKVHKTKTVKEDNNNNNNNRVCFSY
jgi:hypothetical protein